MRVLSAGFCIFLLFSLSCGPDVKDTKGNPQVLKDGSTVYGDGSEDRHDENASSDRQIDADPTSYTDFDGDTQVSSSDIKLAGTMDPDLNHLKWEPIYFDFDQAQVTDSARHKLKQYAGYLQNRPHLRVLLEGHCDHRGTEDYNLALGERRSQSVKRYFLELGVQPEQLRTISYGELRPETMNTDEAAWALNRRVSFAF